MRAWCVCNGSVPSVPRWQGYFEQVELEMMAKAGMTPMQVIVAATGAAAQVSKLDHVGTIAPGKAADLLVLDANPLQDIRNTRQIHSVWIAGRRVGTSGTNQISIAVGAWRGHGQAVDTHYTFLFGEVKRVAE